MNRLIIVLSVFTLIILIPYLGVAENQTRTELEGDLIAAELYCFGLEGLLYQIRDDFNSRDTVYEFYRQGFGPSLAEKLTENIWNDNKVKLKNGDRIMESPEKVQFKSITENFAVISFETPNHRKHIWGDSDTTEVVFKKEAGRWKLFYK